MKKTILLSIFTLICVSFQAFSSTYYVRMSTNTSDWSTKTNVVNYVAGNDLSAIINAYAANDVVWLAKGTYTIGSAMLPKTGMTIAGGFAGNESSLANRPKSDLDGNGFTEAWEFTNATEFVNTTPGITFNAITMKTVSDAKIDGITVKGFSTLGVSYLIYMAANADGCEFKNSIIRDNTVSVTTGTTVIRATFYCNNGTVQSCLFQGNTIQSDVPGGANCFGAGLALYGGVDTPASTTGGIPQAIGCVIRGNKSKNTTSGKCRGAVIIYTANPNYTPTLINSLVYNNETEGQGAGVYIGGPGGTAEIINCTIVKNKAKLSGGGIFLNDTGICLNSILWGNLVTTYANDIYYNNSATTSYTTNYLAFGTKQKISTASGYPALTDSIALTSGISANNSTDSTAIILAPKFVNPTTFTGVPVDAGQITAMEKANFQLIYSSPCVNIADNTSLNILNITTDLLGNNRFINTTADLGAYESTPGTGINDIRFDYKIYTANQHIVLSGLPVGQTLAVYDFAGQLIKSLKISDSTTSIAIAKGLYLVRVANQATKVIVQ